MNNKLTRIPILKFYYQGGIGRINIYNGITLSYIKNIINKHINSYSIIIFDNIIIDSEEKFSILRNKNLNIIRLYIY